MDDGTLSQCNETELLAMAKAQGLGRLRRGLSRDLLESIVIGLVTPGRAEQSGVVETRAQLQRYIAERIEQVRSQLPGCDGCCTTYPCSDGRHALCFGVNEDTVRTPG